MKSKTTNKEILGGLIILIFVLLMFINVVYIFIKIYFIIFKEFIDLFVYVIEFYKIHGVDFLLYIGLPTLFIYCLVIFYTWFKNKYEKRYSNR